MSYFDEMKVNLPEGKSGRVSVEKFEVTESESFLSFLRDGRRRINRGVYTRLMINGSLVMSDTRAEIVDQLPFIRRSHGDILIHGLGLGLCLQAVAKKKEVESVLVIEKNQDVINLVAPIYLERFPDKVEIRQGDAFTWKPEKGQRWNVVWHDIWRNICLDNLEEMKRLYHRFGRRSDWQGAWSRDILEKLSRERKKKEGTSRSR